MRRAEHRRSRRGFTLVELTVALLVGAVAIGGARAVMTTLVDQAARVDSAHAEIATSINGERLLRRLVLEVRTGQEPGSTFSGTAALASFDSRCAMPGGWAEPCRVELRIEPGAGSAENLLIARLSSGERLEVGRLAAGAQLAYLDDAAHGGRWTPRWGPGTAAPLAIGVISSEATLIFPVRRSP